MNILFVAAEVAPFVSVGGLSQVMYFLPQALRNIGHDVRIFTAKYGTMDETAPKGKPWRLHTEFTKLQVPIGNSKDTGKNIECNIKTYINDENKIFAYFLENREYYELRANVFGYRDDHLRFALLCKGTLEYLRQIKKQKNENFWWPDIIHCHDWHTGYFMDLARRNERYSPLFEKTPLVMTVHNFSYQGNYDFRYCPKKDFDEGVNQLAPLFSKKLQTQNALKRGLLYADAINTVSPTHAVEVLTPEYAEGLDSTLQNVKEKLTGILNGLDTTEFNPPTDKYIKKQFTIHNFVRGREENKKDLQKEFSLPVAPNRPLIAMSGRLAKQKGWDLVLDVLPHLLSVKPDVQFVVVGSGDERYRLELSVLQKRFPEQIGLHLRPDFKLPRRVYAGADMILIPSIFEPGGIVALETMRYGCVPIVRRTGGLNDSIIDFDAMNKKGNGFSFREKNPWALFGTMIEALTIYKNQKLWKILIKNCMESDFSWNHAAREYEQWYQNIMDEKRLQRVKSKETQFGEPLLGLHKSI